MRVLGIDPGVKRTGFALVEQEGGELHLITTGVIKQEEEELADRILTVYKKVKGLIEEYRVDALSVEEPFVARNPRAALEVGQVIGALILAAAEEGVRLSSFGASQVKLAVTGYGAADKRQVRECIERLVETPKKVSYHSSDAVAVAICYLHTRNFYECAGEGA